MSSHTPVPSSSRLTHTRIAATNLREAWETHAANFIAWARTPNHDTYWRFHRDQFLSFAPPPGRRTLDLGCGEGRVSRDLDALGHRVGEPAMPEYAVTDSSRNRWRRIPLFLHLRAIKRG